jgi:hypothetical protein
MEGDLLDRRLVDHPLFQEWGAEAQKLYFWLRRHVCRGEAGAPAEALAWRARGFLCVYATAETLMARAAPVSKNTLTKLVAELREIDAARTPSVGRGYLFLLGEWLRRPSPTLGRELYFEAFYLDARLLAGADDPAGRGPAPGAGG